MQNNRKNTRKCSKDLLVSASISVTVYCFIDFFKACSGIGVDWSKTVIALTFADSLSVPKSVRQDPNYKMAVVGSLKCSAETLSSSGVSRVQEEKHVQESLQRNGYPTAFVLRHSLPQPGQGEERTAQAPVTIPYIHGL